MVYNDDESQYNDVKNLLQQLQKVNAPLNFETDLTRRINSGRFESKIKQSFWDKILLPARLIPSAAMAVAAIVMLFVLNTSPSDQENPFSVEPKIREDVLKSGNNAGLSLFIPASSFNKSGLNYRQFYLTDKQKEKIDRLREKLTGYLHIPNAGNK